MVKIAKRNGLAQTCKKRNGFWRSISISETRRDWIPPLRMCTPLVTRTHMRAVCCAHSPAWVGADSKKSQVEKSKNHQKSRIPKKIEKIRSFESEEFLSPNLFYSTHTIKNIIGKIMPHFSRPWLTYVNTLDETMTWYFAKPGTYHVIVSSRALEYVNQGR